MKNSTPINEQTKINHTTQNGWTAETITKDKSGQLWQIDTCKRYSGKIMSIAMQIDSAEKTDTAQVISICGFMSKEKKTIIESTGKATENKIRQQHAKALILFDEQDESKPQSKKQIEDANPIRRGLVIFMWGYGNESHKLVLLENKKHHWTFINLKTFETGYAAHIRPYSKKFGIGYYYYDDSLEYANEDIISNALIENKKLNDQKEAALLKDQAERKQKIEIGMPKLCVPHWAESVIVAIKVKNDSDIMTDYFAKSATEIVYLSWSKHKRNDFKEMRKAAAKFEHTKHYHENKNPDHERRENYTGGSGYYLAVDTYSGWQVKKEAYIQLNSQSYKDEFALAIAENRFFCDDEPELKKKTVEPLTVADGVELLEYSERSFILIGNTKPYKETLGREGLKLKFNSRLTHPITKDKICGWVIPAKRIDEVKKALNLQ